MRDGCRLATDVYLPGDGKYPVLLMMTPYGRKGMRVFGQMLEGSGYCLVVQDVRGRYDSEGEFDPIAQEKLDGPDTVSWMRQQDWFDAKKGIGVIGLSYLSEVGLALAARCPEVRAMINVGGMAEFFDVSHRGGALVIHHSLPWTIITSFSPQPSLKGPDWQQAYATEPTDDAALAAGFDNKLWSEWARELTRNEYWQRWSVAADLPLVDIPILHFSGWYDICLGPTMDLYTYFAAHSSHKQQLYLGPWSHNGVVAGGTRLGDTDFGPHSASRAIERMLNWFDYWLKGDRQKPLAEHDVNLFMTGENEWHGGDSWPPATGREVRFFLASSSRLLEQPGESGTSSFLHDPGNPVPTIGGSVWEFPVAGLNPGPADQGALVCRDDVIRFSTAVLTEPLRMAGPVTLELYGELDGETADWVARLVDVAPDGSRNWVADGILRAHYRNGEEQVYAVSPGVVEQYRINLWVVGHTFDAQHQLAVEVSGSSFPKWNLNRGYIKEGKRQVRQTIHFGVDTPSAIRIWAV